MPCCYHRLETFPDSNCSNDKFKNFPVSDALREIYCVRNGGGFLRRYFLRLACQQSVRSFCNMNEEQHKSHIDECLFRAILEEAAREGKYFKKLCFYLIFTLQKIAMYQEINAKQADLR